MLIITGSIMIVLKRISVIIKIMVTIKSNKNNGNANNKFINTILRNNTTTESTRPIKTPSTV